MRILSVSNRVDCAKEKREKWRSLWVTRGACERDIEREREREREREGEEMKRDERDEIFTVLSFPLFLSFSRSLCPSPSHIRIHTDSHTLIYDIFISIGLRIERHMNSSLSLSH